MCFVNKSKTQVLDKLDAINHICKSKSIWLLSGSTANSFIYKLDSNFVVAEKIISFHIVHETLFTYLSNVCDCLFIQETLDIDS